MNRLLSQLEKEERKVLGQLVKERDKLNIAIDSLHSRLNGKFTVQPKKRRRKWSPEQRAKFMKSLAARKKAARAAA